MLENINGSRQKPCGSPVTVNKRMNNKIAAMQGHNEVAKTLLNAGADVNVVDVDGDTSLHFAARYGHNDTVTTLLNAGANAVDVDGDTPLHAATHYDSKKMTAVLLSARAKLDTQNNNGETPLLTAVRGEWREVALCLIENGAENRINHGFPTLRDVTARSIQQTSLLEQASKGQKVREP